MSGQPLLCRILFSPVSSVSKTRNGSLQQAAHCAIRMRRYESRLTCLLDYLVHFDNLEYRKPLNYSVFYTPVSSESRPSEILAALRRQAYCRVDGPHLFQYFCRYWL